MQKEKLFPTLNTCYYTAIAIAVCSTICWSLVRSVILEFALIAAVVKGGLINLINRRRLIGLPHPDTTMSSSNNDALTPGVTLTQLIGHFSLQFGRQGPEYAVDA
ncbi:hypothetical protein TNCT_338201 [Trichonephila clavata]|uniref:Uncharacterized protein n=1 Tax=Trichonephila clavata TaxID=2740835 RepID=A0A8X6KW87_TRICU|nr:hypothetical protein TNCT_338201 [Trichonephila clavata]